MTTTRDALAALDAGAELIGLNFYPPSPRYLTPEAAGDLVREVRRLRPAAAEDVLWVGVFVDESAEHMADVAEVADLDLLQLHGEEDPADMAALATRIIKVFRVRAATGDEELRTEVMRRMEPWRSLGVWGFLVDTHHPALYGGTGESWNFSALRYLAEDIGDRILLAGGLSPDNVGAALRACKPWGIDLCSGVESEPGRKDSDLLRRLFEEIHDGTTRPAT
ncbi:MAG: phosphoribosylanthranilate isomerase [Thermoanaerobaculia bacterium]|nr:phosphoribosylanthranilate isomerase [Thermoanaerobaculia bacterium]